MHVCECERLPMWTDVRMSIRSSLTWLQGTDSVPSAIAPGMTGESHSHLRAHSRRVRAIPWPSGRWRARRRIDTGHAGRLYGRERALAHVQPRCRGGRGVGRGKRCRLRHRSGGGPPASRGAHGRGRHSAAQRTCARRAWRPKRRTGGRMGLIAARRGA